jgi:signal transducing adaptor molecule
MPYRPASHSPDPRNQIQAGAPPVQQQTPQPDPYQPVHHRPQSTYDHPQELGTSIYDSPVDHPAPAQRLPYPPNAQAPPTGHQQFQQQQQDYSPSVYSSEDPPQAPPASTKPQVPHQFQQQQQQPPYPNSPASQQPAPSHQPPPVPGSQPQYTSYTPPAPAQGGEYQAYQPAGGAPGSNPASFYR